MTTVVRNNDDLRAMFRERLITLGISYETADTIAGLPPGYTSKLLGPKPLRRFGPLAIECLLGACGLKLIAVEDEEAMARVRARFVARRRALSAKAAKHASGIEHVVTRDRDFFRKIGAWGGFASGRKRHAIACKKEDRSRIYRENARKRWGSKGEADATRI